MITYSAPALPLQANQNNSSYFDYLQHFFALKGDPGVMVTYLKRKKNSISDRKYKIKKYLSSYRIKFFC